MNKNSIIGFALIGAILIGFSWYNAKNFREQEKQKAAIDSIAKVEAMKMADELAKTVKPDSLNSGTTVVSSSGDIQKTETSIYKDSSLIKASRETETINFLENKFLKVEFTNIGAQPKTVQVKEFKTYDSLDLMLIKENGSNFSLNFFTNQQLSTSNFGFKLHSSNDTSVVYRLYVDNRCIV